MRTVGIIGAGWWGKNIINTLHAFDDVGSIIVHDVDPARAQQFRDLPKVTFAQSRAELLGHSALTAICIATPPPTHYEMTAEALSAGKHVLVEKPPAMTGREMRELGLLARRMKRVYMLDTLYLFMEPVVALRQYLEAVPVGDIRYVQVYRVGDELRREGAGIQRIQRTMFDNGTDVVEDLFFHDAALLLTLFGEMRLVSVEKQHLYHPSLSDTARIRMEARSIPVELLLSWSLTGRRRGISIYMRDTIVEYDALASEGQIRIHTLSTNEREERSFEQTPPLTPMLRSFIDAAGAGNTNGLDSEFMQQIVDLWETIRNAGS